MTKQMDKYLTHKQISLKHKIEDEYQLKVQFNIAKLYFREKYFYYVMVITYLSEY